MSTREQWRQQQEQEISALRQQMLDSGHSPTGMLIVKYLGLAFGFLVRSFWLIVVIVVAAFVFGWL